MNGRFRLVTTSVTLNDLERRISPYFALFRRIQQLLQANYVRVIEDRPIGLMSAKYGLPVTFGQN